MLCVLVPALTAEIGLGRVQSDYAVTETLDAREASYSAYDQNVADVTAGLYQQFPELTALPAASEEALPSSARRHAYDGLMLAGMVERHQARLEQERTAQGLAEWSAWVSPPMALTLAMERLAGVGADAAADYRSYLVEAVEQRVRWVVVSAWTQAPLDQQSFATLETEAPAPFVWSPRGVQGPGAALLLWLVGGWLFAGVRLAQAERQWTAR